MYSKKYEKLYKNRLDVMQFIEYVKKWNLMKTIVFAMFSAHPTTEAGIIFSSKATNKTHLRKDIQNWVSIGLYYSILVFIVDVSLE